MPRLIKCKDFPKLSWCKWEGEASLCPSWHNFDVPLGLNYRISVLPHKAPYGLFPDTVGVVVVSRSRP